MGTCNCKKPMEQGELDSEVRNRRSSNINHHHYLLRLILTKSRLPEDSSHSSLIDSLVRETIPNIRMGDRDDLNGNPTGMPFEKLIQIMNRENGFLDVVSSIVRIIPPTDPMGPSAINWLLTECPIPSKESLTQLMDMFQLSGSLATQNQDNPTYHRNICIVLGCIAERFAGSSSIDFLTDNILQYLLSNLSANLDPSLILFALLALEKFAQTSENKLSINERLATEAHKPLVSLEKWIDEKDYVRRQVAFCAQWCLDNLFIKVGRTLTYEKVDRSSLNAILNVNDTSDYLKISANGLQARSDSSLFESVRCTFPVDAGVWFYECTIISGGIMQIGWATKDCQFRSEQGAGVGDDEYSVAYDGCRRRIWFNGINVPHEHPCWKPGDVLGTLLDLSQRQIHFYLNGLPLAHAYSEVFDNAKGGFFAAASFTVFEQCEFNFGQQPFHFEPPGQAFFTFNEYAILTDEEKLIVPRHIKLLSLRQISVKEDTCTLCFDKKASVRLEPCAHGGYCQGCAIQLEHCPMCRSSIEELSDSI